MNVNIFDNLQNASETGSVTTRGEIPDFPGPGGSRELPVAFGGRRVRGLHSWKTEAAGGSESLLDCLIRATVRSEVGFIFISLFNKFPPYPNSQKSSGLSCKIG